MTLDRIILHIGSPKTGSSSIQLALRATAGNLLDAGCLVAPYGPAHEFLESLFHPEPEALDLHRLNGRTNRQATQAYNNRCRSALQDALAVHQPQVLILSDERLVNSPDAALQKLATYLHSLARTVEVYCYLREPKSQFTASQKQFVRSGIGRLAKPLADRHFRADRQLPKFIEAFGPALMVRGYEEACRNSGDIVANFYEWARLRVPPPMQEVRANASLSHEGLMLADALNAVAPLMVDGRANAARAKSRWPEDITGRPFQYPPTLLAPHEAAFEAERSFINKTFGISFDTAGGMPTDLSSAAETPWSEPALTSIASILNRALLAAENAAEDKRRLEAKIFYKNGIIAALEDRHADAVRSFGWCLEGWPDHRDCLRRLLDSHLALGQHGQAAKLAAAYAERFPKEPFYRELVASLPAKPD